MRRAFGLSQSHALSQPFCSEGWELCKWGMTLHRCFLRGFIMFQLIFCLLSALSGSSHLSFLIIRMSRGFLRVWFRRSYKYYCQLIILFLFTKYILLVYSRICECIGLPLSNITRLEMILYMIKCFLWRICSPKNGNCNFWAHVLPKLYAVNFAVLKNIYNFPS